MGKLVISLFLILAAAGPALAQAAATNPPAASPSPSAPSATPSPPSPSAGAPSTSPSPARDRFSTEAEAKAHCPDDTIVWVASTRARIYHMSGDRSYGRSRRGAYMCLKDAQSAGMRESRRRGTTSSKAPKATGSTATSGSTNK
jgi:hypothetical protein